MKFFVALKMTGIKFITTYTTTKYQTFSEIKKGSRKGRRERKGM